MNAKLMTPTQPQRLDTRIIHLETNELTITPRCAEILYGEGESAISTNNKTVTIMSTERGFTIRIG